MDSYLSNDNRQSANVAKKEKQISSEPPSKNFLTSLEGLLLRCFKLFSDCCAHNKCCFPRPPV